MNYQKFQKTSLPKFELMELTEPYAININSAETYPFLKPWEEHYKYLIDKHLLPYIHIINIRPEISPTGRLHYHGIVTFKHYYKLFNFYRSDITLQRDINIKIKPIDNEEAWGIYMTKQQTIMSKVMSSKSLNEHDRISLCITQTDMKRYKKDISKLSPLLQFKHNLDT